jgi:asparagine synthase (glutamine-hydrolysing)
MCGIYGMVLNEGRQVHERLLARAVELLEHRGPDDSGTYVSPCRRVGLAHTRLAIIGRNSGHQPMSTPDGRINLAYNGEIYNHRELRRELESGGIEFHTECDTEALLHLYDRDRSNCLAKLEGMFAFAAWDEKTRTFFGARDRLGQKPIYYLERPEGLYFSSEIWPLLLTPGYKPKIDLAALQEYFNYYLPLAPLTMLEGIRKLPPASSFRYEKGRMHIESYWQPDYRKKRTESETELVEECRHLLTEAVRKRLMSEVPLGSMISGGIDSSAVSAIACKVCDTPLRTYSAFYKDAAGRDSDWEYSQLVAKHLGTEHTNLFYDENDLISEVPHVMRHYGEPLGTFLGTVGLALSRLMKQHVTVALSGNGGDEVFAGYRTYRQAAKLDNPWIRAALRLLPAAPFRWMYESLSERLPPSDARWLGLYVLAQRNRAAHSVTHSERFFRRRIFSEEASRQLPRAEESLDLVAGSALADTVLDRWTCGDLMGRMQQNMVTFPDITGMAASLEIRAPLLDHKLVEFAAALPAGMRLKNGRIGKHLLREAVRPYLPPEIFTRPKRGFSGTTFEQLVRCCRGGWKRPMSEILFDANPVLTAGLLRRDGISEAWKTLQQGPEGHPRTVRCFQMVWMLFSLGTWEQQVRGFMSENEETPS